jgi:hypothetical protein
LPSRRTDGVQREGSHTTITAGEAFRGGL